VSAGTRWRLDTGALYQALDTVRRHRGESWRDMARELGLAPSTFSRLAPGSDCQAVPGADALVTLLVWLGRGEALAPFVALRLSAGSAGKSP